MNGWLVGLGALALGGAAGAGACVLLNSGGEILDPSVATGIVYEDIDGDGEQGEDEPGIPGASVLVATDSSTVRVLTSADGSYRVEMPVARFTVSVDSSTLGFMGQLTTGRESYNLNVPPDFFAPNVSFGFQEVRPAAVTGVVFEDVNGDGVQDEGESGLSGVTLLVTHDETGVQSTLTTGGDGSYLFEAVPVNHRISVDTATLPFMGQLTTGRESYNLNVPPDFFAPNVSFGFQEVGGATASGTVFEDLDGDGEQQDGEAGIGGVDVVLLAQDGSGDVVTVTTRDDGRWSHAGGMTMAVVSIDTRTLPEREGQAATLTTDPSTYAVDLAGGTDRDGLDFGIAWVSQPGRAFAARSSNDGPDGDPSEPTETVEPSPSPTVEQCDLVGLWDLRDQAFLDQIAAAAAGSGAGDVSVEYVSGLHTVEMREDGSYTTVRGEWTLRTSTPEGAIVVVIDAVDNGSWVASAEEISIDDPGSTANVQLFIEQDGIRVPLPAPPGGATGSEPIAGSGPYTCQGDVLTVTFEGVVSTFDRIG